MMKKLTIILMSAILVLVLTGCNKNDTNPSNGDSNVINLTKSGFKITADELYDTLKENYATNYLISKIDTAILNDKYETDSDAKEYVENQVNVYKMMYGNDEQKLVENLQSYGYKDLNEFKEYLLLNYKRELATKDYVKADISDSDINKYYENNVYGDITIRHILIDLDITDSMTEEEEKEVQDKANSKIEEIYEKLKNGSSFEDVAKEYSDDSATKDDGGLVGTFSKKEMIDKFNSEIEEAARDLKVGNYTKKAVKSTYGYHIIYKEKQAEKPKLAEVKDMIIDTLVEEAMTDDTKVQYKALIKLREDYGLTINDDVISKQYENAKNNWLYGKDE